VEGPAVEQPVARVRDDRDDDDAGDAGQIGLTDEFAQPRGHGAAVHGGEEGAGQQHGRDQVPPRGPVDAPPGHAEIDDEQTERGARQREHAGETGMAHAVVHQGRQARQRIDELRQRHHGQHDLPRARELRVHPVIQDLVSEHGHEHEHGRIDEHDVAARLQVQPVQTLELATGRQRARGREKDAGQAVRETEDTVRERGRDGEIREPRHADEGTDDELVRIRVRQRREAAQERVRGKAQQLLADRRARPPVAQVRQQAPDAAPQHEAIDRARDHAQQDHFEEAIAQHQHGHRQQRHAGAEQHFDAARDVVAHQRLRHALQVALQLAEEEAERRQFQGRDRL
ncbi:conserved hypothetical protein, partial [Ricinus communis]